MADSVPARSSLDDEVVSIARNDISAFHEEQQKHRAEGLNVPTAVHAGCTIFLGHKGLTNLPEELIDVIKDEVERLALNQNRLTSLSGLGPRFGECVRLKYLVMRDNELRDFPSPILSVPTLEVLDLKGNKIRSLPEDLNKLCNLRNFSIKRNRVEKLPLCIGGMKNLISFTTRRNDIQFPPREEWGVEEVEGENDEDNKARDTEREKLETQKLKKVLLDYAAKGRLKTSSEETSESNAETPRPPARRAISGRFPIKPSVDLSTLPAPASPPTYKPPQIPNKGSSRLGPSPLLATRPLVEPVVSLSNERNRSNSESQMSTSSRAAKRMGFMARKTSEAQVKFDIKKANRLSHNRGLSHGSALQNGSGANDSSSPTSPVEDTPKGVFGRRLSSLPEHKRRSRIQDPQAELARGILFAMYLLHGPIKQLAGLARNGDSKRSSLERTCYNTYTFVDELNKQLTAHQTDEEDEEEDRRKSSTLVQGTCEACIQGFEQLGAAFQRHVDTLVQSANPQYVRTLMHMLYASVVELRNACSKFGVEFQSPARSSKSGSSQGEEAQYSPTAARPTTSIRINQQSPQRNGLPVSPRSPRSPRANRSGYGIKVSRRPPNSNSRSTLASNFGSMRTASETSSPFGTGPSPSLTRSNTMTSIDEHGEDQQFEQIFLKLSSACRYATDAMPRINSILFDSRALAMAREQEGIASEGELAKCDESLTAGRDFLEATESLQSRLGSLKFKEPRVREQLEFWQCVTSFTNYFENFARMIKTLTHLGLIVNASPSSSVSFTSFDASSREGQRTAGTAVRLLVKPILHHVKEAGRLINDSPWQGLAVGPGQAPLAVPTKQLAFSPPMTLSASTFVSHGQAPSQHNYGYGHHGPNGSYQHNSSSNNAYTNPNFSAHTNSNASRSTPPLSLQTRNMPPASASSSFNTEPSSAVSNHSNSSHGFLSSGYATPASGLALSSGHVTPLPATPLSAALGPAVQATVPGGSISGPNGAPLQLQPALFSSSISGGAVNSSNQGTLSSTTAIITTGANGVANGQQHNHWPQRSRSSSQHRRL